MKSDKYKIFISIVSHGHYDLISKNIILNQVKHKENVHIVIKNNIPDNKLPSLNDNNITILDTDYNKGFGENNNIVFKYCTDNLSMQNNDYFIVFNPDVYMDLIDIEKLCESMLKCNEKIATINLYKDNERHIYDNSIRKFPRFYDFLSSFLGLKNQTIINKKYISDSIFSLRFTKGL